VTFETGSFPRKRGNDDDDTRIEAKIKRLWSFPEKSIAGKSRLLAVFFLGVPRFKRSQAWMMAGTAHLSEQDLVSASEFVVASFAMSAESKSHRNYLLFSQTKALRLRHLYSRVSHVVLSNLGTLSASK
jgi:hypothetical protein